MLFVNCNLEVGICNSSNQRDQDINNSNADNTTNSYILYS